MSAAVPGGARRGTRLPRAIWTLGFVSLLMDVSSELVHSLLPVFLVTSLGASTFAVGLIEGVAGATVLLAKLFSGVLSDYWQRRKPLAVFGYALSAASKPMFALASSVGMVLAARVIDRVGKGIRGAPRDSLIADVTAQELRGAAYGLRQALDTVGAFLGPLLAMGLMLLWADDFRAVFRVAVVPGLLAVVLLAVGVREPQRTAPGPARAPIARQNLAGLGRRYWWVVIIGAFLSLARFSEAFLVLRAQRGGLPLALVPLVLMGMNAVYAGSAYPFGKLSDRASHFGLLALGLLVLIGADLALAQSDRWFWVWPGIALWGLHLGITEGLLARMVADTAPALLRGTAFGVFNLVGGVTMLVASALAGLLWDRLGAPATFYAGAAFSVVALFAVAGGAGAMRADPRLDGGPLSARGD
ncbi:putative efflux permease transmembrane protein [Burkholderiales bacterium]|nr:putative efflux permease transmembrane protein [Burkholderiales bacterium]